MVPPGAAASHCESIESTIRTKFPTDKHTLVNKSEARGAVPTNVKPSRLSGAG